MTIELMSLQSLYRVKNTRGRENQHYTAHYAKNIEEMIVKVCGCVRGNRTESIVGTPDPPVEFNSVQFTLAQFSLVHFDSF